MNETRNIDPEHCIGLYYRKKYGKPEELINLKLINKKINENYFTQGFMNFDNSYYTYLNNDYNIDKKFKGFLNIKDLETDNFNGKNVMIRMTPNMSIGGCQYARKFMAKCSLIKTKKGMSFIYKKK